MQLLRFFHDLGSFFWALISLFTHCVGLDALTGTGFGVGTGIKTCRGTVMGNMVHLFLEAADDILSAHMGL